MWYFSCDLGLQFSLGYDVRALIGDIVELFAAAACYLSWLGFNLLFESELLELAGGRRLTTAVILQMKFFLVFFACLLCL